MNSNDSPSPQVSYDAILAKYPSAVRELGKYRTASFACIWRGIEESLLSQATLASPHLDCGCGDGIFSLVTFGSGIGVGVDIDLRSLKRARAYCAYEHVLRADLGFLPFRSSAFGSIVSNSVIEHVADDLAVLQEMRRVSRKDSPLYLTSVSEDLERYTFLEQALSRLPFPLFNEIREWYATWMRRSFAHRRFYTATSLAELANNSGYRSILSVSFGGPVFTAVWSILAFIVTPLPWLLLDLLQLTVRSQIMSSKGAILALIAKAQ